MQIGWRIIIDFNFPFLLSILISPSLTCFHQLPVNTQMWPGQEALIKALFDVARQVFLISKFSLPLEKNKINDIINRIFIKSFGGIYVSYGLRETPNKQVSAMINHSNYNKIYCYYHVYYMTAPLPELWSVRSTARALALYWYYYIFSQLLTLLGCRILCHDHSNKPANTPIMYSK